MSYFQVFLKKINLFKKVYSELLASISLLILKKKILIQMNLVKKKKYHIKNKITKNYWHLHLHPSKKSISWKILVGLHDNSL
jgi:hypothetical protein